MVMFIHTNRLVKVTHWLPVGTLVNQIAGNIFLFEYNCWAGIVTKKITELQNIARSHVRH